MNIRLERRRPAFAPELYARAALAWSMICALLLVTNMDAIGALRFGHPDDIMRLQQVRDLLGGQGWFDLAQHRVDAATGGVDMNWSRLADLPLAAMIGFLSLFTTGTVAEAIAIVTVPLLALGLAVLLAGRIAWRLLGEEAAGLACLAMALSVPLISQMRPLSLGDHGWQVVLALAAMNAMMARNPKTGGWMTGIALALWLAISVEGLPVAAGICGLAIMRWFRDRRDRGWAVHVMASLTAASAVLYFATRGLSVTGQDCGAISLVHIGVFGLVAISVWGLSRMEPLPCTALGAGLGVVAASCGALVYFAAPQCSFAGALGLAPSVAQFGYQGIGASSPVWQQPVVLALQIVVPPLIALLATLQLAGKSAGWLRQWWYDYALLLIVALAVSLWTARAGAVAGALASIPLGWQISQWVRNARNMRRPGKRVLALVGAALALLPAMPLTLFAIAMPAQAALGVAQPRPAPCTSAQVAMALNRLPQGEILAPIDLAPQVLSRTGHSVIAAGHRRAALQMQTVIGLFAGPADTARAILAQRGTAYVAVCPGQSEAANYAKAAPGGLMAQILEGNAPSWLVPVAAPGGGSVKVWKVAVRPV